MRSDGDSVRVIVETARGVRGSSALAAVAAAGGRTAASYRTLLLVDVPIERLARLAASPGLARVRPPARALPSVTSQGVAEVGADDWHGAGLTGAGRKVGIIDGGFTGYTSMLGSELPATVTAWGQGSAGPESEGGEHGAACAEIVHDVAPGASMYIARVENEVDLGNAKDWMKDQGVDVISHSLGWFGTEPGDGTGPINDIVNDAVASGIFWSNAAGNDRLGHWMGDFYDTDADGFMDWDPTGTAAEVNTFWAEAGDPIVGWLRWEDSWTAAEQGYDLWLFFWDSSIPDWVSVAVSDDPQEGVPGQQPVEFVGVDEAPYDGLYAWAIRRVSASVTTVDFDLNSWYQDLDDPSNPAPHFFDHARSISVPADNASVGFMAVGAVGRAPSYNPAYYSSEGPTRDGRLAPEIGAASGVANSVYNPFHGTSASCPHLAGLALLLKEDDPARTPAQLESYIEGNAVDVAPSGTDYRTGHGRAWLPAKRAGTSLSCERSTTSVTYGGTVTLSGVLRDTAGKPLAGKSGLALYRSSNYQAAATYRASASLISNTAFHLRFVGDTSSRPSQSGNVLVLSKAWLSQPAVSTSAPRSGRPFTITGYLRPAHAGKTRIEFYRKIESRWVLHRWYYATNFKLSTTLTKYSLRLSLPYSGYFRIRARHWDSGHAKTYSAWRTFKVS